MNAAHLLAQRRQKDDFFKRHPQSPLTPEQQGQFNGLRYYDPNPDLDLTVTVEPFAEKTRVQVQTTTGGVQIYERYGQFTFTVEGEPARLTLYRADYGFFLPFVDAGAGTETYPAGRYLEPEHLGGNRFLIDFNAAYNPYCAYSDAWTCPITPAENRLKVAIRAGEKLPDDVWVEHAG
ncbi:MAG: DUF1684 domain-containing protein [Anaerolineae bacterium]|nr:DUF1684 domain-containing protein [Anaerolineae bacterium]